MEHVIETWSTVCAMAPHIPLSEGARPYLCMKRWNHPTPVRRQLSLTQAVCGKLIPTGLALVLGMKTRNLDTFLRYSAFHLQFVYGEAQILSPESCLIDSAQLAQTGVQILVSLGEYLRTYLKDHTRYDQGAGLHDKPKRVSLLVGEAQLAGCLKVWVSGLLGWDAGIQ